MANINLITVSKYWQVFVSLEENQLRSVHVQFPSYGWLTILAYNSKISQWISTKLCTVAHLSVTCLGRIHTGHWTELTLSSRSVQETLQFHWIIIVDHTLSSNEHAAFLELTMRRAERELFPVWIQPYYSNN